MKISSRGNQIVSELVNWKEMGYSAPVVIEYCLSSPEKPFACFDKNLSKPVFSKTGRGCKSLVSKITFPDKVYRYHVWEEVG